MRSLSGTILFILLSFVPCSSFAQDQVPTNIVKSYHHIIALIHTDKAAELSKLVAYPLNRSNPIPAIRSAKEFIAQYPSIFDDAFKTKLAQFNDSDIFEHHDSYGLVGGPFNGDIWMNDKGRIETINYISAAEAQLQKTLETKEKQNIHTSVGDFESNILVCRSEKLTIRLDNTAKNGIRYACWSKGNSMSAQPDIILYNGVEEAQGTQGGWTWTFKKGDWTYVVNDAEMCDDPKNCGYFLELYQKGVLKSSVKLKKVQ
ncbi:hypothetical protein ACTHGU_03505 [Chitinophagaceae bacterium MMS25-I14]